MQIVEMLLKIAPRFLVGCVSQLSDIVLQVLPKAWYEQVRVDEHDSRWRMSNRS